MQETPVTEAVVDLAGRGDADLAARVYEEVLVPAFPPEELDTREAFVEEVLAPDGGVTALALTGGSGDDRPLGVIVGYEYRDSHVLLIGYLAVRADLRSGGRGARLLDAGRRRWSAEDWCHLALAEVEDPRYHADPVQDPQRRLAFYQRNGATLLDRPYFQPRLRPDLPRVWGMLLIALWSLPGAMSADQLRSEPVVSFLERYFVDSEGPADPADTALTRLLDAYRSDPTIELLPLDRYPSLEQILAHGEPGSGPLRHR